MTYSIIGRCTETGEIGAAVQSKFPGAGTIVLHGRADVGCITTQAFANPDHGEAGLRLMALGALPADVLPILLRADDNAAQRQIALLAAEGAPAVHTGDDLHNSNGWCGSAVGRDCVASGNTLTNGTVVTAMVRRFEETSGALSVRLIEALRGGRDAGGERRGQQSAALLVVKAGGGYGGVGGRHVDVSVYDHPEPIEELDRCYALHRLSYFPSDPANLIPIDGDIARDLKRIMRAATFRDLGDGGDWTEDHIAAFKRFMGLENYDNRLRRDAQIDTEVLEDLRKRYPAG